MNKWYSQMDRGECSKKIYIDRLKKVLSLLPNKKTLIECVYGDDYSIALLYEYKDNKKLLFEVPMYLYANKNEYGLFPSQDKIEEINRELFEEIVGHDVEIYYRGYFEDYKTPNITNIRSSFLIMKDTIVLATYCKCGKEINFNKDFFINRGHIYCCEEHSKSKKTKANTKESKDLKKKIFSYVKNPDGSISITSYNGEDNEIEIPEKINDMVVTTIDSYAFSPNARAKNIDVRKNITKISIPNTVTEIKICAFFNCSKLKFIQLPNKLKFIDASAFIGTEWYDDKDEELIIVDNCLLGYKGNKKELSVPEKVTTIASGIQFGNLEKLILHNNIERIDSFGFADNSKLKEVYLPEKLKLIESNAFCGCENLEHIVIPNNVEKIECRVFSSCRNLKNVILPEKIDFISDRLFEYCESLESIEIKGNVKSIESCAFIKCSALKNIKFNKNITSIAEGAFADCITLDNVVLPDMLEKLEWNSFGACTCLKNITLNKNLKEIGNQVFEGCIELERIEIPESVVKMGKNVFRNCTKLREICFGNNRIDFDVTTFNDMDAFIVAPKDSYVISYAKEQGLNYKEI